MKLLQETQALTAGRYDISVLIAQTIRIIANIIFVLGLAHCSTSIMPSIERSEIR